MSIGIHSSTPVIVPQRTMAREDGQAAAADRPSPHEGQQGINAPNDADNATNRKALSQSDLKQLQDLKARDQEVRAHEAAHMAAAGGLATGGASFSYQKGPDGVSYATGGEVNIDTSSVSGDPEATIQKAETIQRAALAPANPSGQDRQVAAAAAQMASEARSDLYAQLTKSRLDAVRAYSGKETQTAADASSSRFSVRA